MAGSIKLYRQKIEQECLGALVDLGFSKIGKSCVEMPTEKGFSCWVGLNQGAYANRLCIEPFVGVHVEPIARLYANIDQGKYRVRYNRCVATYAVHIGELPDASGQRAFMFTPEQSLEFQRSEIKRLAALYSTVGLSFARSISSFEALLPLLKERVSMLGGYPQRFACCLYLLGREDEARLFVEEFLTNNWDAFEGFAIPFLRMLDEAI